MNKHRLLIIQGRFPHYRWGVFEKLHKSIGDVKYIQLNNTSTSDLPDFILKNMALKHVSHDWSGCISFFKQVYALNPKSILLGPTPRPFLLLLCCVMQKIRGSKIILWHKGRNPLRQHATVRGKVIEKMIFLLRCLYDRFVVYGQDSLEYFKYIGINANKIIVAQNTINTDEIESGYDTILEHEKHLRRTHNADNSFVILVLCTLKKDKKVEQALDVFSRLNKKYQNIKMIVVGDGDQREYLEKYASEKKINDVVFTGRVPYFYDNYYLKMADVYLIPASAGLAINQAMYMKTAIVCVDEDGADSELVIHNETGLRFPKDDDIAMEKSVERIILDGDLRENLAEQGFKYVKQTASLGNMVRQLEIAVNI